MVKGKRSPQRKRKKKKPKTFLGEYYAALRHVYRVRRGNKRRSATMKRKNAERRAAAKEREETAKR